MTKRIIIAALTFGAVLASVPAWAQSAPVHYGKAVDDGGMVDVASTRSSRPIYNSVSAAPAAPTHYGKGLDDGGMVDNPTGPAPKITWTKYPPHVGRPLDDGGY